jgi:hypothetical protein
MTEDGGQQKQIKSEEPDGRNRPDIFQPKAYFQCEALNSIYYEVNIFHLKDRVVQTDETKEKSDGV